MRDDDIARSVAAALASDFGAGLVAATDSALAAQTETERPRTRSLAGSALTHAAELAVIAHFIITVTPTVRAKWQQLKDRSRVAEGIDNPSLNRDTINKIVETILQKLQSTS